MVQGCVVWPCLLACEGAYADLAVCLASELGAQNRGGMETE